MRLFVACVDEPVYLNPYVAGLLDARAAEVVGVASYRPAPTRMTLRSARRMVALGLLALLAVSPRNLLRLAGWRAAGLLGLRSGRSLEEICARRGVPCVTVRSVNAPDFVERLRTLGVDVLLNQTPEILRGEVLTAPRLGVINRHLAPLPAYRGAWPVFWQFVNGERRFGITIHKVDAGIDTGAVLAQALVDRVPGDTIARVHERLFALAVPLTADALERLQHGAGSPALTAPGACYRTPAPLDVIRFMLGRRHWSPRATA